MNLLNQTRSPAERAAAANSALCCIPQKIQILSGSALKVLAVLAMLVDHIAAALIPSDAFVLCTVLGKQLTLNWLMHAFGRIAFPIFAFLIVEGAHYTRNRLRYGIQLAVFALISEVPWDLLFYNKWFTFEKQNVFFTLLLGYMGICFYEMLRDKFRLQIVSLLGLFVLSVVLRADYSYRGFAFILMVYALSEHRLLQAIITASGLLPGSWMSAFAYIPLMMYNGKRGFIRGKVLKYAFYAFYPAHMLVLFLLRLYQ